MANDATKPVPLDAIDQLAQIRDELRVVWVALGNEDQADAYRHSVIEHVNGLVNRLHDVVEAISGEALEAMA